MLRLRPPQPRVTRSRHLSAVYLPAFCLGPAELENASLAITAFASAPMPMVQVGAPTTRVAAQDRIVLIAHGTAMAVPASDGETCDPYLFHMAQAIQVGFRRNLAPPPAYLESLAGPLARHLQQYYLGRTRQREREGLSPERLARTLAFIDTHPSRPLSVGDLAEAAFLSPFHFCHMFKRSTGMAPQAFVTGRRLAVAKELLRTTRLPIAEIARRTGYENQGHFSTTFRRVLGTTPSTFRRACD